MLAARLVAAALLLGLAGCSTVGRKEEVVGSQAAIKIVNRHTGAVTVSVIGGDERLITGQVFSDALLQTLGDNKIFSSASAAKGGNYELNVVIMSMSHPFLAYVADMTTLWTLRTPEGKELWSETINASGHSAQFGGVARTRASFEGAARASIEIGVSKLSELDARTLQP
jgi:uncharacterized membrane protein